MKLLRPLLSFDNFKRTALNDSYLNTNEIPDMDFNKTYKN